MITPIEAWAYAWPAATCGNMCRSPQHYELVVKQFDVEKAERYQSKKFELKNTDGSPMMDAKGQQLYRTETYCNAFSWDVTRALAAEIPHWWYGKELSANGTFDWLEKYGAIAGWKKVSQIEAAASAAQGRPTVAVWKNPKGGPGHIAIVLPDGTIAQAGAQNFYGKPLAHGFGSYVPLFFTHD